MSLGSKINEIRKQKGLSIDELCEKSGIPKGTLSKITAGITTSPTLDTVRAIANALGCRLDDLDDTPIKKSPGVDESAPRDEQEKSVMNLVSELSADQQEFLLAWLKTTIELRQQKPPSQQE